MKHCKNTLDKDYSITFKQLGEPMPRWAEILKVKVKEIEMIPMFSYDRVSSTFWSAFCNQLIKDGRTEEEAFKLMQSSDIRHMLDGTDHLIRNLAKKIARKEFKNK